MNRFQPSVESLETRETPSAVTGRITAVAVDPANSDSFNLRTLDDRSSPGSTGSTGGYKHPDLYINVWINNAVPSASASVRARMFAIVDRTTLGGNDSIWIDVGTPVRGAHGSQDISLKGQKIGANSAVNANETITVDFNRTETAATRTGNVYTVTFGGSLVG